MPGSGAGGNIGAKAASWHLSAMYRTPAPIRKLLKLGGYTYDPTVHVWVRDGGQPRTLHADIACWMTREQVVAWIKAGEGQ